MDLYILLGVERAATLNDIKRAYKRLARKYHPDINPGDRMAAQHFRQIAEAYETLSDPERRRRYDTVGPTMGAASPVAFGFEGFDFTVSANGSAASTFGDLFADALTAPFEMGAAQRGADIHHPVSLTLEQACTGSRHQISLTRHERCGVCAGFGQLRSAAERPCAACEGSGEIRSARGHMIFMKPCSACRGTGAVSSMPCTACHGRQTALRAESLAIDVPPGVSDGDQVRLPGKGHAGRNGGEAGDLLVTLEVMPHAVFHREGDDLRMTLPIAVHEAALGARVEVPGVDGQPAKVKVPPGTQSGQRFRLRERGMPSLRDGQRGDLLVEVRIVLPAVLDERSKELLREFGRINGGDVRREATARQEGWRS
jgi:molecular chaperone DnaJ